jgi:dihydroorotate dehydrogenase electron transfer subunit
VSERVLAPLGRRACDVAGNRRSGSYRIFSAIDREGPRPEAGQFYMLAAEAGWGGEEGRPFLPRAFSVADADEGDEGVRLEFLAEAVGPGTERLVGLSEGERLWVTGPLGRPFSAPTEVSAGAAGAVLVGGGIGVAPLALLRRRFAEEGIATRVLLGFRDEAHAGGTDLFDCSEVRIATEDGHSGHHGRVTDLLGVLLAGDDPQSGVVYACGPPAMLEAVRVMCAEHGVTAELAMESPMACGYGACFGCAVPLAEGGFMRLCVDGPVVRGDEIETALVAGSGH